MKVTATQRGFLHSIKNPGDEFEIDDEPKRKILPADDRVTQSIQVKGEVPRAFSSHWMRPGWATPAPIAEEQDEEEQPAKGKGKGKDKSEVI